MPRDRDTQSALHYYSQQLPSHHSLNTSLFRPASEICKLTPRIHAHFGAHCLLLCPLLHIRLTTPSHSARSTPRRLVWLARFTLRSARLASMFKCKNHIVDQCTSPRCIPFAVLCVSRSPVPSSRDGRRERSPVPSSRGGGGGGADGGAFNLFVAGFTFITSSRDLESKFGRYGRVTQVRPQACRPPHSQFNQLA